MAAVLASGPPWAASEGSKEYEVRVLGSVEEAVAYWKEQGFWGEEERGKTLLVPRAITVAVNSTWSQEAEQVPVDVKRELFYRSAAPLILYANELIASDRERLQSIARRYGAADRLDPDETRWLGQLAIQYRLNDPEDPIPSEAEFLAAIDELLLRVDIIPPALLLGQAAYESGYGTPRFALTGSALFGHWTLGGKLMKALPPRKAKGDHRVANYDWPFDSVSAHMLNLNTHQAYAELRQVRAELRSRGEKLTGLALAGTLTRYSERGQAPAQTLQDIIRTNTFDAADEARLRDETSLLLVQAKDPEEKVDAECEIEKLRSSGELEQILTGMRLNQAR